MENGQKSKYHQPITISEAISSIEHREFLLPAIQRKFVWTSKKIETLFDSIMRDYPINTFMLWNVTDEKIKTDYKFYEFLKEYREYFNDENPYIETNGFSNFKAIIDGQQRLTALYLGLKGSYAYRMPRKWLKNNEESLPTRKLYLNLSSECNEEDEEKKIYDFMFLSIEDFKKMEVKEDLFLVGDIYSLRDEDALEDYLGNREWQDKKYAKRTLRRLRKVIFETPIINYYQEESQDLEAVLDMFVRTNSGGETLTTSNLLMSLLSYRWKHDARKEFDSLRDKVFENGFYISSDLILKCCLVLFNNNIQFQLKNFKPDVIVKYDDNWERIQKCIITAFELLKKWGYNDSSLRAKNAIIPIVYFIYHHDVENEILKDNKLEEVKIEIRKWLAISLMKGIFGGQSDGVLRGIREVLIDSASADHFPLMEIKTAFASHQSKSLSFSEEEIDKILTTQKEAPNCHAILSLLYSHLHFDTVVYHKDHLHPAAKFTKLKRNDFETQEQYDFYTNKENWNSILNLQLLSSSTNESKNAEDLDIWVVKKNIDLKSQLIPQDVNLSFDYFEEFIGKRKLLLKKKIKSIVM